MGRRRWAGNRRALEFGETAGEGQERKEQLPANIEAVKGQAKGTSLALETVGMVVPCVDGLNS